MILATSESGAHPRCKEALVSAEAVGTVLAEALGVWWPEAPHRVLRSAVQAAEALDDHQAGQLMTAGGSLFPGSRSCRPAALPRDTSTRWRCTQASRWAR